MGAAAVGTIDALVAPLIPEDLPSALLQRRPDILQAEQNLVAANANIGAARALYYPTISLTGALGSASTAFGNFLTGPATAWALVAGLTGPVFTFGAIEGQVRSAEAGEKQALNVYQQTILNAFREKLAGQPHLTFNPGVILGGTAVEFDATK